MLLCGRNGIMWQEIPAKNIFKNWNGFVLCNYFPIVSAWMQTFLKNVHTAKQNELSLEQAVYRFTESLLLVVSLSLSRPQRGLYFVWKPEGGVGHCTAACSCVVWAGSRPRL